MSYFCSAIFIFFTIVPSFVYAMERGDLQIYRVLEGNLFIVKKDLEIDSKTKLYAYEKNQLQALGQIIKCKEYYCLGKLSKKRSTYTLTKNSLLYLYLKKLKKNKILIKDEKKPDIPYAHSISLELGGPLSSSFLTKYYLDKRNHQLNFGVGFINTTIANINISGTGPSFGLAYKYYQTNPFVFQVKTVLDYYSTKFDFTAVNNSEYVKTLSFINFQILHNLEYNLSKKLYFGSDIGFGYNNLASSYEDDEDNEYKILFSGALLQINLYMRYLF